MIKNKGDIKVKKEVHEVDRLLNRIQQNARKERMYLEMFASLNAMENWDVLDGRTRTGRPIKKIAKLFNLLFIVAAYLVLSGLLTYVMILWMF